MSQAKIEKIPSILVMPDKMMTFVEEFNLKKYFLAEGGRSSSKTQSVSRILLAIGEQRVVRIVCGRETQSSIQESVYTVFADLIQEFGLVNYQVMANEIRHKNGTTIKFKGFREQGSVNIKGLEGVDIVWIDEAQAITKKTLDVLIPTIRKSGAKLFFTMNRYMRDDPVYSFLEGRDDCIHVKINYFDNPFCPLDMKNEAEICRARSEREYRHIWLGEPLETADDYLFNYNRLYACEDRQAFGESPYRQSVMGIDFAAQGNDLCVATILERASNQHFVVKDVISWDEPDPMQSVGRIVNLIGKYRPDVTVLDVGGMGNVVHSRLVEVGLNILRFDGATTGGVDTVHYGNLRASAYFTAVDWVDNEFLCVPKEHNHALKELEKIRFKYKSNGQRLIEDKLKMKKSIGHSPDFADSIVMAIWAAANFLSERSSSLIGGNSSITRVNKSMRRL